MPPPKKKEPIGRPEIAHPGRGLGEGSLTLKVSILNVPGLGPRRIRAHCPFPCEVAGASTFGELWAKCFGKQNAWIADISGGLLGGIGKGLSPKFPDPTRPLQDDQRMLSL